MVVLSRHSLSVLLRSYVYFLTTVVEANKCTVKFRMHSIISANYGNFHVLTTLGRVPQNPQD